MLWAASVWVAKVLRGNLLHLPTGVLRCLLRPLPRARAAEARVIWLPQAIPQNWRPVRALIRRALAAPCRARSETLTVRLMSEHPSRFRSQFFALSFT